MKMAATWPREPCGVGESLILWTVIGLELTGVLGRLGNSPSTVMCFLHWGAEEGQFGSGLQSSKGGGERGDVCSGGSDGGRDDGRDGSEVVSAMRTRLYLHLYCRGCWWRRHDCS